MLFPIINSKGLLVINRKGMLKVLYCPFTVITITALGSIPPSTRMIVEQVNNTAEGLLIYIVNGKPYSFLNFHIFMQF